MANVKNAPPPSDIYIHGYKLNAPLSNANAGFAKWGYATKNGKEYFLKEFLDPVYPTAESPYSSEQKGRIREACWKYQTAQTRLYDAVNRASDGNLICIEEFFRYGSKYYIATPRIHSLGISLEDLVRFDFPQRVRICLALSHAMMRLHGIGIVHADIKPDNILLTRTASQSITAKIIDIDSSFFEGEPPEEITGDQVYFAPETALYMLGLADDIQPNRKIDVFALGLIFHQILTGIPVSFPPGYHYAFEACLDDKPLSLSPQLPEAFRPILLGMLATEPDQRSSTEDVFLQLKQQYMELVNAAGSPVRPVRPAPSAASAAPSSAGDLRLKINGLHASGAFDAINTRSSSGAPPAPAAPSAEDNDPFFLPGSL